MKIRSHLKNDEFIPSHFADKVDVFFCGQTFKSNAMYNLNNYIIKVFDMFNQDDNMHYQQNKPQNQHLYDILLQEPQEPIKEPSLQIHPPLLTGSSNSTFLAQQEDQRQLSFLNLDEVSICSQQQEEPFPILPAQNLEKIQEEHFLLEKTASKKQDQDQKPNSKKAISKEDKQTYAQETRQIKIKRYKQKKTRRVWVRKIFYDCRKVVADSRVRVNGRFTKKSPNTPLIDSPTKRTQIQLNSVLIFSSKPQKMDQQSQFQLE